MMSVSLIAELDWVSGMLVALTTLLIAIGFVRLALSSHGATRHFAAGLMIIHTAVFIRTVYRDIMPMAAGSEAWTQAVGPTLHTIVTIAINLMILYSAWHSLKALHLAIPEADRSRYTLVTAALYPPWGVSQMPRMLLRHLTRRRR